MATKNLISDKNGVYDLEAVTAIVAQAPGPHAGASARPTAILHTAGRTFRTDLDFEQTVRKWLGAPAAAVKAAAPPQKSATESLVDSLSSGTQGA